MAVNVMPNYQPITKDQHSTLRWKRAARYDHAAADAVVPLVVQELPSACKAIADRVHSVGDGPVSSLLRFKGLKPGRNLLVVNGRWVGNYVPAQYRHRPFALSEISPGRFTLCVIEEEGELVDRSFDANVL
jgi:hypothetical protein